MGRHPVSTGVRADGAEFRNELLSRFGLEASASDQDIETAYNAQVEFLELAPGQTRSWAATQIREADETYALLSGSAENLAAASTHAASVTDGKPAQTPATPSVTRLAALKPFQGKILWIGLPLVALAIIFGVKGMGQEAVPGMSGTPTTQTTTAGQPAAVPVDKAKVAALMAKIGANPKDKASLQGLGDAYFAASDYKTAAVWEQKVLDVDPKDQVALLALGAALFNKGDLVAAEKPWLEAAKLYPNLAEVHYDLGFLYMNQQKMPEMTAEWNKVIAIDPKSEIAKTVATHLKGSQNPSHGATATPSAK